MGESNIACCRLKTLNCMTYWPIDRVNMIVHSKMKSRHRYRLATYFIINLNNPTLLYEFVPNEAMRYINAPVKDLFYSKILRVINRAVCE